MNYKKILCPTDLSAASLEALHYAAALARESDALLLIAHVEEAPLNYTEAELYFTAGQYPNPEIRRLFEAVTPPGKAVRYEHRLLMGVAADDIVKLADEEIVDLIVMASHGRTGLRRVLMGSVAEMVIRMAKCPVLIVKPGQANLAECASAKPAGAAGDGSPK